jgi:hypothetical protein
VALWTYRNGVCYGRLNSSAEEIALDAETYVTDPPGRGDLPWRALSPTRVLVEKGEREMVRVTNRFSGGEFAVSYALDGPVDLGATPVMRLPAGIPEGVKVNLHLRVNKTWCIVPLTGPTGKTYRVLGDAAAFDVRPTWRLLANRPLGFPTVDGSPAKAIKNEYRVDLLREMKKRFHGATSFRLEKLIVGNSSHKDYLMAGLSGNAAGASYMLGKPVFGRR